MQILFTILIATIAICSQTVEAQSKHSFKKSTKSKPSAPKKADNAYPVKGKLLKNMDLSELDQMLTYAKKNNDSDLVFKAFYHILSQLSDHEKIKTYKLDLADCCYGQQDYEKSATTYEEFCVLYPGCKEAEYAQYKLILCTFYLSLEADRDQSATIKTLNLIVHFLKYAKNEKFIDELNAIFKTCRKRLLDHEIIVIDTFLKQHKFVGAAKRIEHVKSNFLDVENIEKYSKYLDEMFELVKNPETRPFTFKLDSKKALSVKEKKSTSRSEVQKAVSFFVA